MSETTGISWTERTWNPWAGCKKISRGCWNCYMFRDFGRFGRYPRILRKAQTRRQPLKWENEAKVAGTPIMVFTCSMSDWFHADADRWRDEAWGVVRNCPHLIFQILTKRATRIVDHLPADWGEGYPNVWLGVSIEDNDHVWRADVLRHIPAQVRFISAEPLLGPLPDLDLTGIHWLIVGGESGGRYRKMDHAWAKELRDRAQAAGIAFFFKQSAGARPGKGDLLDGRRWKEFPSQALPGSAVQVLERKPT